MQKLVVARANAVSSYFIINSYETEARWLARQISDKYFQRRDELLEFRTKARLPRDTFKHVHHLRISLSPFFSSCFSLLFRGTKASQGWMINLAAPVCELSLKARRGDLQSTRRTRRFKGVEAARFFGTKPWVVETSKGLIHAVAFDTRFFTVHTVARRRYRGKERVQGRRSVLCYLMRHPRLDAFKKPWGEKSCFSLTTLSGLPAPLCVEKFNRMFSNNQFSKIKRLPRTEEG